MGGSRTPVTFSSTRPGSLGLTLLLGVAFPGKTARAQVAVPPLVPATAPLVIRGVTVIDVRDGRQLADRAVVIAGTRIQAIGPAATTTLPKGARVIDGHGKYLIPGLWDMHVHPHQYVDLAYPLFIANGVTGVRDAGSMVPLATLAQWKRDIAAGTRVGPRHLVSGPRMYEAPAAQTTVTANTDELSVPRATLGWAVDSLKAAGADFIKTYFFSREGYFTLAAAARRAGIPFGGHLPAGDSNRGQVDGREASDSGATFLDHEPWLLDHVCGGGKPDSFDLVQCRAAGERFRRNNTWVTVVAQGSLNGFTGQSDAAYLAYFRARMRRYLPHSFPFFGADSADAVADAQAVVRAPTATADWALGTLPTMDSRRLARWHEAGLPMVIGTDMNVRPVGWYDAWTPGFVEHEALAALALSGLTPLEALQTATLNPAIALRATDSLGTVAAGKLADLVLLDADPLADIWNTTKIRAVIANGRYYDRAALDRLLTTAEQAASRR